LDTSAGLLRPLLPLIVLRTGQLPLQASRNAVSGEEEGGGGGEEEEEEEEESWFDLLGFSKGAARKTSTVAEEVRQPYSSSRRSGDDVTALTNAANVVNRLGVYPHRPIAIPPPRLAAPRIPSAKAAPPAKARTTTTTKATTITTSKKRLVASNSSTVAVRKEPRLKTPAFATSVIPKAKQAKQPRATNATAKTIVGAPKPKKKTPATPSKEQPRSADSKPKPKPATRESKVGRQEPPSPSGGTRDGDINPGAKRSVATGGTEKSEADTESRSRQELELAYAAAIQEARRITEVRRRLMLQAAASTSTRPTKQQKHRSGVGGSSASGGGKGSRGNATRHLSPLFSAVVGSSGKPGKSGDMQQQQQQQQQRRGGAAAAAWSRDALPGQALAPTMAQWATACGLQSSDQLALTLQAGRAARESLVAMNAGLVGAVCRKYRSAVMQQGGVVTMADLKQEATIGLIRAAEK